MKQQSNGIEQLASQHKQINQAQIKITTNQPLNQHKKTSSPVLRIFTCKICLSQVSQNKISQSGLIQPCMCTGTMKYVHEECLVEWLNMIIKTNLQKGQNTNKVFCQICKVPYQYQIYKQIVCAPREQIKQKVKLNWGIFLLGTIFILGSLAAIIFQTYLVISGKISPTGSASSDYVLLLVSIILLTVVILLWVARIIYFFLLKKLNFIKSVRKSQNPQPIIEFNPESSLNQINEANKWK